MKEFELDALMIVAVLCAYFVKGMCGFANTLVHSTILSFRDNNINITPVELLIGYPSNVLIAWKERKAIDIKSCVPLAALVFLGCIPGTFLLKNGNVGTVKIFFGVVVTAIGIEMFCREYQKKKHKGSRAVLFGIITKVVVRQALLLMPFMLIGLFLGMAAAKVMKESAVKRVVLVMLILSGVSLVISNL